MNIMKKNNMGVGTAVAGIAIGLAAGTAAYAMSGGMKGYSRRRKIKKTADAAMKNMGAVVENVSNMLK